MFQNLSYFEAEQGGEGLWGAQGLILRLMLAPA